MSIKVGKSVNVSIVHFNYSGDSFKQIQKSNSLYCYYYNFSSFSISYNNEPYDIIANADNTSVPGSLAFIKKGNALYVIIMTVAVENKNMLPDQLFNIIK